MRISPDRAAQSPLLWLNLVCLDAPLIAICWQWIFAYSFHLSVRPGHWAALFLTAWIIYLADRLGDSLSVVAGEPKSLRQQFCLRHKNIWFVSIICVGVLDLIVVLRAVNYETACTRRDTRCVHNRLSGDQSCAQPNLGDYSAERTYHWLIICRRHSGGRHTSYLRGKIGTDFRGYSLRRTLLVELR